MDFQIRDSGVISRNKYFLAEDINGNQTQIASGNFSVDKQKSINFNINIDRFDVVEKNMEEFQKQINEFIMQCKADCEYGNMPFIYNCIENNKQK